MAVPTPSAAAAPPAAEAVRQVPAGAAVVQLPAGVTAPGTLIVVPGGAGHTDAANAAPSGCPPNYFCFWNQAGYTGRMGKLRGCGLQNLATWNWQYQVVSAFYNLEYGTVAFRSSPTAELFRVSAGKRALADAGYLGGRATYVYRWC